MCEVLGFQLIYKHLESQVPASASASCLRIRAAPGHYSRRKFSCKDIFMPVSYLPEILILLFWAKVGVGWGERTNSIICRALDQKEYRVSRQYQQNIEPSVPRVI